MCREKAEYKLGRDVLERFVKTRRTVIFSEAGEKTVDDESFEGSRGFDIEKLEDETVQEIGKIISSAFLGLSNSLQLSQSAMEDLLKNETFSAHQIPDHEVVCVEFDYKDEAQFQVETVRYLEEEKRAAEKGGRDCRYVDVIAHGLTVHEFCIYLPLVLADCYYQEGVRLVKAFPASLRLCAIGADDRDNFSIAQQPPYCLEELKRETFINIGRVFCSSISGEGELNFSEDAIKDLTDHENRPYFEGGSKFEGSIIEITRDSPENIRSAIQEKFEAEQRKARGNEMRRGATYFIRGQRTQDFIDFLQWKVRAIKSGLALEKKVIVDRQQPEACQVSQDVSQNQTANVKVSTITVLRANKGAGRGPVSTPYKNKSECCIF